MPNDKRPPVEELKPGDKGTKTYLDEKRQLVTVSDEAHKRLFPVDEPAKESS